MSTEGEQGLGRQLRELKEAKTRYDLAVRATTDGIWDWNIIGDELYLTEPLQEMLDSPAVGRYFSTTYKVDTADVLASFGDADAHRLPTLLAERVRVDRSQLVGELAREYAYSMGPTEMSTLVEQLKDAAARP